MPRSPRRRAMGNGLSLILDHTGSGLVEAGQYIEECGLASPVRSDQPTDLGGNEVEVDTPQSRDATESNGDVADFKDRGSEGAGMSKTPPNGSSIRHGSASPRWTGARWCSRHVG